MRVWYGGRAVIDWGRGFGAVNGSDEVHDGSVACAVEWVGGPVVEHAGAVVDAVGVSVGNDGAESLLPAGSPGLVGGTGSEVGEPGGLLFERGVDEVFDAPVDEVDALVDGGLVFGWEWVWGKGEESGDGARPPGGCFAGGVLS